jgi:AraC-like DNA-binding protein
MINIYDAILSDPDYFRQLAVKDLLLVNYQCPQIERWEQLYSHMNHIIYTLGGSRVLSRPGELREVKEGDLIFIRRGAFRQGVFSGDGWRVIVFCVPDSYLQNLVKEFRAQWPACKSGSSSSNGLIDLQTNEMTHGYFYSLLPYFTQQPSPPENLVELKCRELIFHLLSNPGNTVMRGYMIELADQVKPSLATIMEANYTYNLSLEELARISQRSLTIFKKEFMEVFQTTPGKWLIRKRLDHAQRLLAASQKTVREIAYESGFESVTHFSRVFKMQFGESPLRFRRQESAS